MARVLCVGHAVEDHVFQVETLPTEGRKYQSKGFEIVGGGPAANAAVAIARLGGDVRLAARVGGDAIGQSIVTALCTEGIDCTHVKVFPGVSSSLSAVFIDDRGERMIVNHRPADLPTDPSWLDAAFAQPVDAVLADVRWPEGAKASLDAARERGIPGILDADLPVPAGPSLVKAASHVAFSADGLVDFTGQNDLAEALLAAASATNAWCCVTAGADGAFIAQGDRITPVPAYACDVVDTLGAGDIWHGAFALALADGMPPEEAVAFGNAAAALKVSRAGGRKGAPYRAELETFTQSQDQSIRSERKARQ
ncbi:MAG: PfkB family carbohydrate kinase [Pseudomonadota bacterium]